MLSVKLGHFGKLRPPREFFPLGTTAEFFPCNSQIQPEHRVFRIKLEGLHPAIPSRVVAHIGWVFRLRAPFFGTLTYKLFGRTSMSRCQVCRGSGGAEEEVHLSSLAADRFICIDVALQAGYSPDVLC